MDMLDYTRRRLSAFVVELEKLTHIEFAYAHSREALHILWDIFKEEERILDNLATRRDSVTIKQACENALSMVSLFLPLLGFLLRSTNVRNAFEVYDPLLRLAGDVLEPELAISDRKTRLVLSSEWEYSPFAYMSIPGLPGFVLIGVPAPESSNPLLMAVAGHELGHEVWTRHGLAGGIRDRVEEELETAVLGQWETYVRLFPYVDRMRKAGIRLDLTHRSTWADASKWSLSQAKETFADFIALGLFGLSYVHAYAYLFCPRPGVPRSLTYPNTLKRIGYWERAARRFDLGLPKGYKGLFHDRPLPPLTEEHKFLLEIADEATDALIDELIEKAQEIMEKAGIERDPQHQDEQDRIYECFKKWVVPAEECKCLADILNAAWRAAEEGEDLWKDKPQIKARSQEVLKDLVLKNIEIFEIEQIVREG
jgi:hypothetical protein